MKSLSDVRVLIVEDEKELLTIYCEMLTLAGAEVIQATNMSEAFDKIQEDCNYQMVMSDLKMPGGSGLDLYLKLKEETNFSGKFVVITGYADRPTATHLKEAGIDRVLHKPVAMDDLIAQIKN